MLSGFGVLMIVTPVSTRRCFDVVTTLLTSKQPFSHLQNDVMCWDILWQALLLLNRAVFLYDAVTLFEVVVACLSGVQDFSIVRLNWLVVWRLAYNCSSLPPYFVEILWNLKFLEKYLCISRGSFYRCWWRRFHQKGWLYQMIFLLDVVWSWIEGESMLVSWPFKNQKRFSSVEYICR